MKKIVIIFIFIFFCLKGHCTVQIPDFLIMGNDTLRMNEYPLSDYFHQIHFDFYENFAKKYMELIDSNGIIRTIGTPSNCWDNYVAYWKIENDSLILWSIDDCCKCIPLSSDEIIKEIFGDKKIFAYWFSGEIKIPRSPYLEELSSEFFPVYELEEEIIFKNGVVQTRQLISNKEKNKIIILEKKLQNNITNLKDTFNYYFQKKISIKKKFQENCYCSDTYQINYHKTGKLKSIHIVPFFQDEGTYWEKFLDNLYRAKCIRQVKSELSKLSLSFIKAHRDFQITIKKMDESGTILLFYES